MTESVPKAIIYPDLNKISNYLGGWHTERYTKLGYVELELIMPIEQYEKIKSKLLTTFDKYGLTEDREELIYIIIIEDEILDGMIYGDKLRYNETQKAIDVSKFLLTFKNAKDNPLFQIGVKENVGTIFKPKTQSAFIQDAEISKWMCQLVLDAIETGKYPQYDIFGEFFTESIAGLNFGDRLPISDKSLKYGANLKNKSHTVFRKKRYVHFCFAVLRYLENFTHLKTPQGVKITDVQSNFLFEVLEILGYINGDEIDSEPKDYINSMIRNNSK